jgi:hypothetical protein
MELKLAEIVFLWQSTREIPHMVMIAESVNAETQVLGQNPYGRPESGCLTVRSSLLKTTSRKFEIGSYDYFNTRNLLSISGDDIGRADFDETVWPTRPFWCVPLVQSGPEQRHVIGLTVMPLVRDLADSLKFLDISDKTSTPTTFFRIGRFNSEMPEIFEAAEMRTIVIV